MPKYKSGAPPSPSIFADIDRWVQYMDAMNEGQVHAVKQRLRRLYGISETIEQQHKDREASLWRLLNA
jgi:hypothetical protein